MPVTNLSLSKKKGAAEGGLELEAGMPIYKYPYGVRVLFPRPTWPALSLWWGLPSSSVIWEAGTSAQGFGRGEIESSEAFCRASGGGLRASWMLLDGF